MAENLNKRRTIKIIFMLFIAMFSLAHMYTFVNAADLEEENPAGVNIRKRAQWTNAETGDALLTLQYSSELGTMQMTPNMNVMIIQDKSGSMDSNYGHNLEVIRSNWGNVQNWESEYYPILNDVAYSETVSDIKNEGYDTYFKRLIYFDSYNGAGCHDSHVGYNNGMLHNAEMFSNSPCQNAEHYYFVIKNIDLNHNGEIETEEGELYAWRMVSGAHLYNIDATDLHHYKRLNSREEALDYLAAGRRVVRMTTGYYINENAQIITVSETAPVYFLDMTELVNYGSGWILSTCGKHECQESDRLRQSQDFLSELTEQLSQMNPENKIAYIPFWGNVPEHGVWTNWSGEEDGSGLYSETDGSQITEKDNVTKLDFTTDVSAVIEQIADPFTYNGTNWSIAFQNAVQMIEKQIAQDEQAGEEKETIVIFLTDGQPQGYAGKAIDLQNPSINGESELAVLQSMSNVTIFACGVCINQNNGDVEHRLNSMDTTGEASYARTTAEFDVLTNDLFQKIYDRFLVEIYGEYAFFTDTLSHDFELDERKLDDSWKILETPYSYDRKGVPYNVYSSVVNSTSINKVYVRSTKTIYWYIGTLDTGGYEDAGHTTTVPVTYNGYETHTCVGDSSINGSNTTVSANTVQTLTYYTNYLDGYLDGNEAMASIWIETPKLIFNRSRSRINIRKYIRNTVFDTPQTFTFAYSKTKYAGGDIVKDSLGTVAVTIAAGSTTNYMYLYDLDAGTYYFYEVDKDLKVINSTVNSATVSYTGTISTQAYSSAYPYSITTSDSGVVTNNDNVLTVKASSTSYEYFYNYYTSISGTKIWMDDNDAIGLRPDSYTLALYRNDEYFTEKNFLSDENWEFTNLERDDPEGNAYRYTIKEEPIVLNKMYKYIPTIEGTEVTNTLTDVSDSGDITVVKRIPCESIVWTHGNPIFVICINGKTQQGDDVEFYHTFEFSKDYVDKMAEAGYVQMSYTFEDLPYSTRYYIEEIGVSRYSLESIRFNPSGGGICGTLAGNTKEGFYKNYGYLVLVQGLDDWTVTLTNKPTNYRWYSHRAAISNFIRWDN